MKIRHLGEEEFALPKTLSKKDSEFIVRLSQELHVPVGQLTIEKPWDRSYPRIIWDGDDICQTCSDDYPEISLSEMIEKIISAPFKESFTIQLTNDYEAEVTKDGITVGCQKITFEKFDELCELVKQARK
jgi:hypothetical protein